LTRSAKASTGIDFLIGHRVYKARLAAGITVRELADQLGVTAQQLHKYERGVNRLPASRLVEIANALGFQISFFFEGSADELKTSTLSEESLNLAFEFDRLTKSDRGKALFVAHQLLRKLHARFASQQANLTQIATK
jgi:transcriptional regulator with XRE-family HTH domain